jgi:hypothetical protein
MKRIVVFMFVSTLITEPQRTEIDMGSALMIMVGVRDYKMACEEAVKLAAEGAVLVELCGGFGTIGHAQVTEAVYGKVPVGVVRFDNHPGYAGDTGDNKFR